MPKKKNDSISKSSNHFQRKNFSENRTGPSKKGKTSSENQSGPSKEGKKIGSKPAKNSNSGSPSTFNPPPGQKPSENNPHSSAGKNSSLHRVEYENNTIFWCRECNLPLIGEECGICGKPGEPIILSQPADVRICSPYEHEILVRELKAGFGCNPLGERLVLLNKIPGEDKTDEVLVDGFNFGVLRFELSKMDYTFEPSLAGAGVLLDRTESKRACLKKTNKHLNGKNVEAELIDSFSPDIRKGDYVLVSAGRLKGYGISYIDGPEFGSKKDPDPSEKVLRIRKIESGGAALSPKVPDLASCIEANRKHLQVLGKNAINTIRGIANRKEHKALPFYVSFSGGKDSLVAFDLTKAALKQREFKAFFLNTGIEFPETVDFVRKFCNENGVPYEEMDAGAAFWTNVEKFGPPAKDFRWCCKVCKLASAGSLEKEKDSISLQESGLAPTNGRVRAGTDNENRAGRKIGEQVEGHVGEQVEGHVGGQAEGQEGGLRDRTAYLTVDGKRKHESFSRARIAASEKNPFVPSQLNIFPIRDWRALEVWLYIHWRKLDYNPLYDLGFERVGCWLCPAALAAEYERVKELHPDMYAKWNGFLLEWARSRGLSDKFVEHGFWRWKELPPKMLKLAEELDIPVRSEASGNDFELEVTGGISPCKAGGFSVEAGIKGIRVSDAAEFMSIVGKCILSEELGMLLVKTDTGTAKFFSNGNLLVSSDTKAEASALFRKLAEQLIRLSRCTRCGICEKACPVGAVSVDERGIHISESCIRCGKCTESCVVTKYFDKLVPDLDDKLQI